MKEFTNYSATTYSTFSGAVRGAGRAKGGSKRGIDFDVTRNADGRFVIAWAVEKVAKPVSEHQDKPSRATRAYQNGVYRPSTTGGVIGTLFAHFDAALAASEGGVLKFKDAFATLPNAQSYNINTLRTNFWSWKRFNGLNC